MRFHKTPIAIERYIAEVTITRLICYAPAQDWEKTEIIVVDRLPRIC